ncbi:MAG TPA: GNAT family N-acetyltransferase [Legionella sp.]|nr:GNAT family N-acetyltransferase [Legionella sp.]
MVNVEIIPITEEHIEGFWSAVDSVARERKYLAFLEGPPINCTREFVLGNIEENWPHFIAVSDGQIIGWCDISALDRPVFAHTGSLGIGILASYRGLGIGKRLMEMSIQKADQKGLTRIELTVREKISQSLPCMKNLDLKRKESIKMLSVLMENMKTTFLWHFY